MGGTVDSIQLFAPSFAVEECLEEIRACLEAGWTGLGYKTLAFEEAWRAYTGLPHAHFLNSATAGLHLALRILKEARGWAEGDEVITTPLTFVSTNHAILYEKLTPVFADVDRYLCLDPDSIAARMTPRTRAVMFVGHGGNAGQWDAVVELCRSRSVALVLDAAHQSGTTFKGRLPAAEADAAVFSFQAVKNLPTADSGMICFAQAEHDAAARRLSWLGIDKDTYQRTLAGGRYAWSYEVDEVGYKYHGNSVMAAIGLVQLRHLEAGNAERRRLAALYDRHLGQAGMAAEGLEIVPVTPGCLPSRHLYQLRVRDRDGLIAHLHEQRIFPGVHYRDNTRYKPYRQAFGTCPKAAAASAEVVSLPLHLRLSETDVARVAAAIRAYFGATVAGAAC